jgi:hypothetical protein
MRSTLRLKKEVGAPDSGKLHYSSQACCANAEPLVPHNQEWLLRLKYYCTEADQKTQVL